MSAQRRGQGTRRQQPSWALAITGAGLCAGAVATYLHLPGAAVLWLALLIAAWTEPPTVLTGRRDEAGFPTPAHPSEQRSLRRYRFWSYLRWRLLLPNPAWLPGWPPLASAGAAVALGLAAWCLPVSPLVPAAEWINAAAAIVVCTTVTAARRVTAPEGPDCPGTRVDTLPALLGGRRGLTVAGVAAAVAAVATGLVLVLTPTDGEWAPPSRPLTALAAGLVALTVVVARPWQEAALADWRALRHWGAIWEDRWKGIRMDPAPALTGHRQVGPAVVDEFTAPTGMGAQAFWPLATKIAPSIGAGHRVAILELPDTDRARQPIPGSRHPLRFQVVSWPVADPPDLSDPDTPDPVAHLYARCAFAWTTDALGYGRAVLVDAETIARTCDSPLPEHGPPRQHCDPDNERDDDPNPGEDVEPVGSTTARASWWAFPGGPSLTEIRRALLSDLAANFGCQVLIDHRRDVLYFGALTEPTTDYPEPDTAVTMANLAREDHWNFVWSQVLKQDANPPTIQHATMATHRLRFRGRQVVLHRVGFVTLQGLDPTQYFGLEAKLATALNAAPFVSVTGWPAPAGSPGSRHPQAFAVAWTEGPAPDSAAELDDGGVASTVLLAGMVNRAFAAARLARPEVDDARVLTTPGSRGHIWEVIVRLYGGVTLADVRGAAARLQRELAVPWLRITPAEAGCTIFAGELPASVELAQPSRDRLRLVRLDWHQAFVEAKITGNNALVPDLTASGALPRNERVGVLDFLLPPGLDLARVRAGIDKLRVATGNDFVDVRPGPAGASSLRLLVSPTNPLPPAVDFDFDAADRAEGIVFATGVDGEPVAFNSAESPHLLVAGSSGSGKAQPLDSRLPVPVNQRFPDGWARIGDLQVGDLVYTASGSTSPVVGLSDIHTEEVYELSLSDGQVVRCSGNHLWKVSSMASRYQHRLRGIKRRNSLASAVRARRVAELRSLATRIGVGKLGSLTDISRLSGAEISMVRKVADRALGVPIMVPVGQKKASEFRPTDVIRAFGVGMIIAGCAVTEGFHDRLRAMPGAASVRDIAHALVDSVPSRQLCIAVKDRLKSADMVAVSFTSERRLGYVYPVDEVLWSLADAYEAAVRRPQSEERVWTTKELSEKVHVQTDRPTASNWAIRLTKPPTSGDVVLPVDPYLLGCWLGDGSSWHPEITSDPKNGDQVHLLAQFRDAGYVVKVKQSEPTAVWVSGLGPKLRSLNLPRNKHIPATYLRASYGQRLALLQGLMDTDGTVGTSGRCEIALSDTVLADGVIELIRSLGIKAASSISPASYRRGDGRLVKCRDSVRIHFTTTDPVCRLPRKLRRLPKETRSTQGWLYITGIRVLDPAPMRCISIADPEHIYLTDGFVPTHNSVLIQALLYGAAARHADVVVVDPIKGGADFRFARPWARGFATDLAQAAAVMKAIHAIVMQRKEANAAAGAGSYRDLPDPPTPIYLFIDEFTSLMEPETVPKPSDDPDVEVERDRIQAQNLARQTIGVLTGRLAREARSAGVSLVLGTQKLSARMLDSIPGAADLKVQVARILLGKASYGDRASALRVPDDAPALPGDIPKGRGLFEPLTSSAVAVQTWFATQGQLREDLDRRRLPLRPDEVLDLGPFLAKNPPPDDDPGSVIEPAGQVTDLADLVFELTDLDDASELVTDKAAAHHPRPDLGVDEAQAGPQHDPCVPVDGAVDRPDALVCLDVVGLTRMGRRPSTTSPGAVMEMVAALRRGYDGADPPQVPGDAMVLIHAGSMSDRDVAGLDATIPAGATILRDDRSPGPGWWKLDRLQRHLSTRPGVRRIVWLDGELAQEDGDLGVTHAELAGEMLLNAGIAHLLIPSLRDGPTAGEIEAALAFLGAGHRPDRDDEESSGATGPKAGRPAGPEDDPFARRQPSGPGRFAAGRAVNPEEDPFAGPGHTRGRASRARAGGSVAVADDDPFMAGRGAPGMPRM